jgi:putative transcriptional regulator
MDTKGKEHRSAVMDSFQGQFLVAVPRQLDPNFANAVVLVCGHTRRGAFGVIVNDFRGTNERLQRRSAGRRCFAKERLFTGGPVGGPLMAVHTSAFLGERQILPGVFFSKKDTTLLTLARQADHPCKVFAGYVGWAAGQLNAEVERGAWRVVPAMPELIFGETGDLWDQLSQQASRTQLQSMFRIRHIPASPLLN